MRSEKLIRKAIACLERKRFVEAESALKSALKIEQNNYLPIYLMGIAKASQGKHIDAISFFKKAVHIQPTDATLFFNLASATAASGNWSDTVDYLNRAKCLDPLSIPIRLNLGLGLMSLNQIDLALEEFEWIIRNYPVSSWEAYLNKGVALSSKFFYEESIKAIDIAIDLNPDNVDARINKGLSLFGASRFEDALAAYDEALMLDPSSSKAWSSKGVALKELGRFEDALAAYDEALMLDPTLSKVWCNKGVALRELGKFEEAIVAYDSALSIEPNSVEALLNRGYVELQMFQFREGWPHYDLRWSAGQEGILQTSKPRWQGARGDSRLLIWSEQGIGDQILYGSMFNDLARVPNHKTVAITPKLIPIFERSFPGFKFLDRYGDISQIQFDEQIPMGSLGGIFREKLDNFKFSAPYLIADKEKTERIRSSFMKDKIVCGLSWKSANKSVGRFKSISIEHLAPILTMKKLEFLSLQYGENAEDIEYASRIGCDMRRLDSINLYDDIDGLASIISACDLIVTVSNSTAHLAGALGKEVILLIPRAAGKFWYWHAINGKSLWYPSVSIFEQGSHQDWSAAVINAKDYINSNY